MTYLIIFYKFPSLPALFTVLQPIQPVPQIVHLNIVFII